MRRRDFIWDTGWTMNRFFQLIRGFSGKFPVAPEWAGETAHPPVDIIEDEKGLLVELEAPGMSRERLTVRIDGDRLMIEGFKEGGHEVGCLRYLCLEREYGMFRRTVDIPAKIDTSGVSAELADGVLRIRMPRVTEKRKRTIEIPIDGEAGAADD